VQVTEEQWEDMKEAMSLLASDWDFIVGESWPHVLLKELQRNEQELFRFKDDKRFPAAEVNEWLQTVRKWMKKIPGGNSLPSGNLIRQKTQAPNINQKRKAEKDTQVS